MFKNILIAYDGSEHSKAAARIAGDIALHQEEGARLWVATVMDPIPREFGEPYFSQTIETRTIAGQKLIEEAVALIPGRVQIQRELLFGTPAESILRAAETRECDLIVMGTHGISPLEGALVGSQVQKVINHAHCPVLVVR